jgi:hypothetical protein
VSVRLPREIPKDYLTGVWVCLSKHSVDPAIGALWNALEFVIPSGWLTIPVNPVDPVEKTYSVNRFNSQAQSAKEHAMSLWKHEENPDKIGFNREP